MGFGCSILKRVVLCGCVAAPVVLEVERVLVQALLLILRLREASKVCRVLIIGCKVGLLDGWCQRGRWWEAWRIPCMTEERQRAVGKRGG